LNFITASGHNELLFPWPATGATSQEATAATVATLAATIAAAATLPPGFGFSFSSCF